MRRTKWTILAGLGGLGAVPLLAVSCGGGSVGTSGADASSDARVVTEAATLNNDVGPGPDANVPHCTFGDGTDPVALCTQKTVLTALHKHAFDSKAGVATSWSPTTGLADVGDAGARLHDWTDDVGYAAAASLYLTSAFAYGDIQLTPTLTTDLSALTSILEKELAPLPAGYSGEPYQRLRVAAGGLRTINQLTDGNAIDAIADAYGRAAYSGYFFALAAAPRDAGVDASGPTDGGKGISDAGKDAADATKGVADAAKDAAKDAADATTGVHDAAKDAPDAALAAGDGIFGRPTPTSGVYSYVTADVATAAYAMLDLAVRDSTDAGHAECSRWQLAAEAAFDHLYNRARDPSTGLYYTALVTSSDPGHDALDTSMVNPGLLLSDTTATVALALTRARDLVTANPTTLNLVQAYPFGDRIADALASLQAPSLYDGPADAGGGSATGFMQGYEPEAGVVTAKPTRPNAFILAVLNRQFYAVGTRWGTEIGAVTRTLINPSPANTSLFSVIAGQDAFFGACARSFQPLAADAGQDVDSYQSAAVVAFVEGMNMLMPQQAQIPLDQ